MSNPATPGPEGRRSTPSRDPASSPDATPETSEGSGGHPSGDPALHEAVGERAATSTDTVVQDVEFPELDSPGGSAAPSGIGRLLDIRLTLSVELGRRQMLVQEVLNLGQGSILDLEKSSAEPVDVLINGKLLARGEVVVIDENFGVRITSLVDPIERVRCMG